MPRKKKAPEPDIGVGQPIIYVEKARTGRPPATHIALITRVKPHDRLDLVYVRKIPLGDKRAGSPKLVRAVPPKSEKRESDCWL